MVAKKSPVKPPAKKAAVAKKAAPASKSAPVKKAAVAKKAVPAKKAPARPIAKKAVPAKNSPAKAAVAKKAAPAKKAAVAKKAVPAKKAPAKPIAKKAVPAPKPPVKPIAKKAVPAKKAIAPARVPVVAPAAPAKKAVPAKKVAKRQLAPSGKPMVREDESPWTTAELKQVRAALLLDVQRLEDELDNADAGLADLIRDSGEGAGDDQADAGSKTFEREHEMSLANNARDMLVQVTHAIARLDTGTYGACESCGKPIGKYRLQAFPRATLCLVCKQADERLSL
ncbi:MAG: TraR/DksA C4-type zinc finger protein [Actinomycetota bacterium]|nr:TraR/DksA C4-type zinc finger protein [Actinomycetota bacterium]